MPYRITEKITNLTDNTYSDWNSFNYEINLNYKDGEYWINAFEQKAILMNKSEDWPNLLSVITDENFIKDIIWNTETQSATRVFDFPTKEMFDFWYEIRLMFPGPEFVGQSNVQYEIISQEEI